MNGMEKKWGTWLLIIGGLNWGLVGLGHFLGNDLNVIHMLLGTWAAVENLVYLIVGLCALWMVYLEVSKK